MEPEQRRDSKETEASRILSRFERLPSILLYVTAVGHVVVGLVLFREPLLAIWRAGIVNSIDAQLLPGAQSWLTSARPRFEREAAFWFVLFGPCLWMVGQIVRRAVEVRDGRTLRIVAWDLFALGIVGVIVMPVSGFWLVIGFTPLLLRVASRVEENEGRRGLAPPATGARDLRWVRQDGAGR